MPSALPTEKPRYAFVDLAKGLCIMLVVWHHVASTWGLDTYPLKLPLLLILRLTVFCIISRGQNSIVIPPIRQI